MRVLLSAVLALVVQAPPGPGARVLFRFADPRITEASGIAPGRASPGVVYVQNDSGDANRFFAVDRRTGRTAAIVTVTGARNVDWEDIASAPAADGTPSVWLADIGDNDAERAEVQVYRVVEPRIRAGERDRRVRVRVAQVWRLRYPGGPVDAESLAVAPDGTAYVVTKSLRRTVVYRLPAHPIRGRVQHLRRVATLPLWAATSAAVAPDGSAFVVRTYTAAYVWWLHGAAVRADLARRPIVVSLPLQPQGEGVGVMGSVLLLDSEGVHAAVYAVRLPGRPGASASPSPSTGGSGRAAGSDASIALIAGIAAAVALAAGVVLIARRRR